MFQVPGIWNAEGEDVTSLIDVGKHYSSLIEVKQDMALKIKID